MHEAHASRTEDGTVRLSLCMIVRDNASTLGACLASIRPWVDEMVVVDTGSKDSTPQIARDLGACVYDFKWCDDFSAARNESLRHARGEWLFWMDSDDTIDAENARRLRELAYGMHKPCILGYVMQVHCPGRDDDVGEGMTVVDHIKMFRNHPQLRFEFRIHEQVLPAIRRLGGGVAWTDIHVVHSGSDHSDQGRQYKYERDLRILNLEIKERPDHPGRRGQPLKDKIPRAGALVSVPGDVVCVPLLARMPELRCAVPWPSDSDGSLAACGQAVRHASGRRCCGRRLHRDLASGITSIMASR